MCPFSHDLEANARPTPCKYFAKVELPSIGNSVRPLIRTQGHCKFGRKCALMHINPDGSLANRGPAMPPGPPFVFGGRAPTGHYGPPPPPGMLSLQVQDTSMLDMRPNGDGPPEDFHNYQYGPKPGYDVPQIDMTFASDVNSPAYGSPQHDSRFATSPPGKGLSVLDAPMPSSFDSQGISMAARNGPFASSVPARFGLESPPSSLPRKSQLGNNALRDLHNSAFGDRSNLDGVLAGLGSSPPSGTDEPLTFPKRSLHSDRLAAPRPLVSASLGTRLPTESFGYGSDEDDDTDREEDLLPASLHDLIDEKKIRRPSRHHNEEDTPASFLASQRRTISTPQDSKVGSPHSSSPSRYGATFARANAARTEGDGTSTPPGFMHVGSPLRNTGFPFSSRPIGSSSNGDLSPKLSSPPRQASMSMLTQELQRTKLDAVRSQSGGHTSHPGVSRTLSNGSSGRSGLDRAMSSTSVGRERIEEEQELFSMDEVGPQKSAPRSIPNGSTASSGDGKRSMYGLSPGKSEATLGAIGGQRAPK